MLRFDGVELRQGNFRLRADFEVPKGARVALLGPSGGGKSTLLAALAGFLLPCAGRILLDGAEITTTSPAQRPVTLLFQDHNLFPHMTALQNTGLGLRPDLRLSATEWQTARDALGRVGLRGQEDKRPAALSGGQQQRVALARALLRDQPVLCLDEPFAALGPALKREMLDLVAEITAATGATLLMVTHQPEDALRIASHTVVIAGGKARTPVATADLFADPPQELKDYLGL